MLLAQGGGSATIIGGTIPYSTSITKKTMGGTPDKIVDEPVARILAMSAFQTAKEHRDSDADPIFGVGGTSVLQKTPEEREGRTHVIYAALQTDTKTVSVTLNIPPEHPVRQSDPYYVRKTEEHLNAIMMLNLIAEGCGIKDRIVLPNDLDQIVVRRESSLSHYLIPWLLTSKVPAMCFDCSSSNGVVPASVMPAPVLMPGSYRPFHNGHQEMLQKAKEITGGCHLELSIANADKPWVDLLSLEERLNTIADTNENSVHVWITTEPIFLRKAAIFPGSTFAVGVDTAKRIVDPHYGLPLEQIVSGFKNTRTSFLVYPRIDGGVLENNLDCLPKEFASICTLVEGFRNDNSSTKMRTKTKE